MKGEHHFAGIMMILGIEVAEDGTGAGMVDLTEIEMTTHDHREEIHHMMIVDIDQAHVMNVALIPTMAVDTMTIETVMGGEIEIEVEREIKVEREIEVEIVIVVAEINDTGKEMGTTVDRMIILPTIGEVVHLRINTQQENSHIIDPPHQKHHTVADLLPHKHHIAVELHHGGHLHHGIHTVDHHPQQKTEDTTPTEGLDTHMI